MDILTINTKKFSIIARKQGYMGWLVNFEFEFWGNGKRQTIQIHKITGAGDSKYFISIQPADSDGWLHLGEMFLRQGEWGWRLNQHEFLNGEELRMIIELLNWPEKYTAKEMRCSSLQIRTLIELPGG